VVDRTDFFITKMASYSRVSCVKANDCWKLEDETSRFVGGNQAAVRWYGSVLGDSAAQTSDRMPIRSKPPPHRQSTDISLDAAIAEAILKNQFSEFALLSPEERRVLAWNLKNIEYALGANAKDLSMKFWDIDERHAFEGDHVLLRQGYSSVIDHLLQLLKKHEARFRCLLNFPVGSIEYNRKTTTQPYIDVPNSREKLIELSDTCCVTSQDGSRCVKSDFVVSAVPLGVLKSSIQQNNFLRFNPPLPFLKRDAINSVGFGLLNKIYLQFAHPFWETVLGEHQSQFGNASGLHPHHYMFVDIGKTLLRDGKSPAILMTLVSGKEAVVCEKLSDEALVEQLMEVLRSLFSLIDVPEPVAFKITRWGSDPFARGSYTFLAPGTTDQDFEMLQSPVNGNGDSLQLEGTEIMRLFMAGEHTTALHPSMAHGALCKYNKRLCRLPSMHYFLTFCNCS
jgi:lysine-specific histone demethylase 1